MRVFLGTIPLVGVLATGWLVAQAPPDRPPPRPGTAAERPLQFDVDGFFRDFDRNGDGFLTPEELPPELRGSFERIDANRDGRISRDELARGIAHLQPRQRPSDMVYMLIEMSDVDAESQAEVQRAYDILRKLDKNKDGKIDPDELRAERERLVAGRVDGLIKQLDADGDGRISRAEAKGQIREHFAEIDRNRDGFIEREELLRAARERPAAAPANPDRRPGAATTPDRRPPAAPNPDRRPPATPPNPDRPPAPPVPPGGR